LCFRFFNGTFTSSHYTSKPWRNTPWMLTLSTLWQIVNFPLQCKQNVPDETMARKAHGKVFIVPFPTTNTTLSNFSISKYGCWYEHSQYTSHHHFVISTGDIIQQAAVMGNAVPRKDHDRSLPYPLRFDRPSYRSTLYILNYWRRHKIARVRNKLHIQWIQSKWVMNWHHRIPDAIYEVSYKPM
jgi:hypothetical protein